MLAPLNFLPRTNSLVRDDVRADIRSDHAPRRCAVTYGAAPRGARATPSIAGASAVPATSAPSCDNGQVALGLAVTCVERLANGTRHGEARDGHRYNDLAKQQGSHGRLPHMFYGPGAA